MHKWFLNIHFWIRKNKWLAVVLAVVWLALGAYFASRISFEEDITRIIPKNKQTSETAKVLKQLRFTDKISVIIEKKDKGTVDDMVAAAEAFLDTITVAKPYIKDIQGKVDEAFLQQSFRFVYENMPLFLDAEDYNVIENKIQADSIRKALQQNFETMISPSGVVMKDFVMKDPLGFSFIALRKMQKMHASRDFKLYDGFLITNDSSRLLLFINPTLAGSETEQNTLFVKQLYGIQKKLNNRYHDKAHIDYFGSALIAVANADRIKTDIITTVLISMGTLMVILMLFYRRVFIPLVIFIPSLFGAVTALALMYFIKESISAISISIGAILLGITIDYALHILTHYKSNADVAVLYKEITKPLFMSSSTTAVAFICLFFVHSEALIDLGIFASVTIMVSAFFSLLLVPHLYRPETELKPSNTIIDKTAKVSFHNNRLLQIISILLIIVSLFTFHKVGFDNDLSKLNYIPDALKASELKLETSANAKSKSLYITAFGNREDEVLRQNEKVLQQLQQMEVPVTGVQSIANFVMPKEHQAKKIAQWQQFWTVTKRNKVRQNIQAIGTETGFSDAAFGAFDSLLNKKFRTLALHDYQKQASFLTDEFMVDQNGFYTISTLVKIPEKQREAFVKEWKTPENTLLIDRQQMSESFLGQLVTDFNDLINYSFLAVLLILWLFFRRIELVIISAIPIAITGLVTAGLMGIFNIPLNIFSTIVCTLIFGHGVDFSIFMTSALQKEYTTGKNELQTYRTSILLAVLTTILAIGALVFAQHPALKSISLVSLIGVFAALVITFVFYPLLFKIVISNRPKKGLSPVSIGLFLQSVVFFVYYGVFGILLSVSLRLLLRLLPLSEEKKYRVFGKAMSWFMTSVLYLKPTVKKGILNPYNENFKKQSVIISNHTSFLDTLAIGMYHPHIVFLVNDWVYKSPIFGKAVRLAGFFPVSQGVEGNLDQLRKRIGTNFSLMIFPEGTRSKTNDIGRFHKGAFYLAEQLKLDILPIYIHGNSEVIPKGDFIIYDGQIIDYVDKRIAPDDERFGKTYAERTKKISAFFKQRFDTIRRDLEDENYFKKKLLLSFLYKEHAVVKQVKADFSQNKSIYYQLNSFLGKNEKIIHIANDYGQLDFLLVMQQASRQLQTYIADEEKREIAQTNYIIQTRKLIYVDDLDTVSEKYSTLLVSKTQVPENIPGYITKIIVVLADTKQITGFDCISEEGAVQVFKRVTHA